MTATTDISGLDVLRAVSEGVVEMPPAAVLLGWKALDLQPGRARVQYAARPDFCNPHGAIQAGGARGDRRSGWRMQDGVLEQVGHDLVDLGVVAGDRRQIIRDLD